MGMFDIFRYKRVRSFEQAQELPDGARIDIKISRRPWRRTSVTGRNHVQVLLAATDEIQGRMYGPYGNNAITPSSFDRFVGHKPIKARTPRW